jgi:hypothetical protein
MASRRYTDEKQITACVFRTLQFSSLLKNMVASAGQFYPPGDLCHEKYRSSYAGNTRVTRRNVNRVIRRRRRSDAHVFARTLPGKIVFGRKKS